MLVLARRVGESITIDDDIVIKVLEMSGTKVRFGIAAPREITVHRTEVYEQEKLKREGMNPAT